jgi:hypothetical protein
MQDAHNPGRWAISATVIGPNLELCQYTTCLRRFSEDFLKAIL